MPKQNSVWDCLLPRWQQVILDGDTDNHFLVNLIRTTYKVSIPAEVRGKSVEEFKKYLEGVLVPGSYAMEAPAPAARPATAARPVFQPLPYETITGTVALPCVIRVKRILTVKIEEDGVQTKSLDIPLEVLRRGREAILEWVTSQKAVFTEKRADTDTTKIIWESEELLDDEEIKEVQCHYEEERMQATLAANPATPVQGGAENGNPITDIA